MEGILYVLGIDAYFIKCKKNSEGRAFCIVIQAFDTVRKVLCFGCSGSVIGSSTAYILI